MTKPGERQWQRTPRANPPLGDLSKLSELAKIVVQGPAIAADAYLDIANIHTRKQVRIKFRDLEVLAASIRENGIVEPLVVHEEADGRYRVIVGERRYRAAPLAGLSEVPVVIKRGLTELQIRAMQVAENNEREDLTAYEKAMGVIEDVEKYGVKAAMRIWNVRSEGWISKRMAVRRYHPVTLAILRDELSGDLEVQLPVLERLGAERSKTYLKRLQDELKRRAPASLWRELHPSTSIDDPASRDTPVPPIPAGWRF